MTVISYSRCKKCGREIRDIDTGNQVYFEPCKQCAAQQQRAVDAPKPCENFRRARDGKCFNCGCEQSAHSG